jgi:hypothetical protein
MTVMSAEALDELPLRSSRLRRAQGARAHRAAPAHSWVSSRQPASSPSRPKGTVDGWLGRGAGRGRGFTQDGMVWRPEPCAAGDLLEAIRGAGRTIIDPTTGEAYLEEELPAPDRSGARGWGSDAPATDSPRRNLFDTGAGRCHLLRQVQQRKGGDPMSHVMVARLAPANETLVTSARIG